MVVMIPVVGFQTTSRYLLASKKRLETSSGMAIEVCEMKISNARLQMLRIEYLVSGVREDNTTQRTCTLREFLVQGARLETLVKSLPLRSKVVHIDAVFWMLVDFKMKPAMLSRKVLVREVRLSRTRWASEKEDLRRLIEEIFHRIM